MLIVCGIYIAELKVMLGQLRYCNARIESIKRQDGTSGSH
jgi:hypothetical protein